MLLNTLLLLPFLVSGLVSPVASICISFPEQNGADPYVAYGVAASSYSVPLYLSQGSIISFAAGEQAILSKTSLTGLWSYSNVTGAISVIHGCGTGYSLNVGPSKINPIQPYKRQTSTSDVIVPLSWGSASTTKWSYVKQGNITVIGAPGVNTLVPYTKFLACLNGGGNWVLYIIRQPVYQPAYQPATDATGSPFTTCVTTQIRVIDSPLE